MTLSDLEDQLSETLLNTIPWKIQYMLRYLQYVYRRIENRYSAEGLHHWHSRTLHSKW